MWSRTMPQQVWSASPSPEVVPESVPYCSPCGTVTVFITCTVREKACWKSSVAEDGWMAREEYVKKVDESMIALKLA